MLVIERPETAGASLDYNRLKAAPLSSDWAEAAEREARIHSIHVYPAKFPALIFQKAIELATRRGVEVKRIGDIFCGSGTVLYETAVRNLEFWGCDINPVATLIARVKGMRPDLEAFTAAADRISLRFETASRASTLSPVAVSRLTPWYRAGQFEDLVKLRNAIESETEDHSEARLLFDCAFSAIAKPTSQWKARSTKPARHEEKTPAPVLQSFQKQCRLMMAAWAEASSATLPPFEVHRADVKSVPGPAAPLDLIITSPPYAMSYEYADVHQLSALWLNYAEDHRDLRRDVIGTASRRSNLSFALRNLNPVGLQIVFRLFEKDRALAESLASYFLDMQQVVGRCHDFLRPGGVCVFVVGNTQLKDVRIDNANHMVECFIDAGFENISVLRRPLSNKPNTPYRQANGRLSSTPTRMGIYAEEYVVMAQRR
ncbi:class I SAM-dependent methyltransferase [Caulobacter sp. SLTY]|uniref:site-specific DNA-methyltransferase n=1 Tax=Caulobacter sp. SLTY TaxID=2683262 RepID=UPI001411C9B0|nr:site-specific DNA-methyltransferase [Caulobacter sp. SLTY]NBB17588.1 class I SAM-dependent methyltransferase [Caulobacter sp. SLTY]